MLHEITLNLSVDALDHDQQQALIALYQQMTHWHGSHDGIPSWFGQEGDDRYIVASAEPSGLQLTAELPTELWTGWISMFCARLSLLVGRPVYDATI